MGMSASNLDRRIQFRRRALVDDGFSMVEQWIDHDTPIAASRRDVADAEKFVGGMFEATIDTRFIVRASSFTRNLSPLDRLICEGLDYDIIGIKQVGPRHAWLELSCRARAD